MALKVLEYQRQLKNKQEELNTVKQEVESLETRAQEIQDDFLNHQDQNDQEFFAQLLKEDSTLQNDIQERNSIIETLNTEIDELNQKVEKSKEGEKAEMSIEKAKVDEEKLDVRSALNTYLHTKQIDRANGFVSDDGAVLIPQEIVYQPRDEVFTEQDLEQYINTVSVSAPTGKYPILLRTSEKMHTVEELAENPRLANPKFDEVLWDVDTYRGFIPISQEAIDDSAVDLLSLISRHILRIVLNTTNSLVAPIIKEFQPVIAKSLDDLKKMDNVMLDPAYQRAYYMSRTMYNYIDTLKDTHGNYILQDDITSPSGKTLFGYNVIRINDNLIGSYNGHMVCFFGDMKAAITKFNRKEISAQWNDNDHYDNRIQAGFRADYEACDSKAGYYVLFTPPERDLKLTTSDEQTPETVAGVSADITVVNNVATIKYTGLTDQPILYQLLDSKGALVAEMTGRFTSEKTEDQITITFAQDMVYGEYTLNAKVLDQKKYKTVKSVKIKIESKGSDVAKTSLKGTPIVIGND